MSSKGSSSVGGIIGLVVGFILVGGIAGTPFYVSMLQSEDRSVDLAAEQDVATVRRVVLAIDAHLATLKDIDDSLAGENELTTEEISDIIEEYPDLLSKDVLDDLTRSSQKLRKLEALDRERGTEIAGGGSVASGKPNVRAAVSQMKSKYLKANEVLLRKAETAGNNLRSLRVGEASAASRLPATRVQAILKWSEGRLHLNRAEFEQTQAATLRQNAGRIIEGLATLDRKTQTLEIQKPEKVLSRLQDDIAEQDNLIAAVTATISDLEREISNMEATLAEARETANGAREEMTALNPNALTPQTYQQRYSSLATVARRAEADQASLINGSLEDATLESDADGRTVYVGGTAVTGIRDYKERLAQQQSILSHHEDLKELLVARHAELTELNDSLSSRQQDLTDRVQALSGDVEDTLQAAQAHDTAADEATQNAIKAFSQAQKYVGQALTATRRIKSKAQQASSASGGKQDDHTRMIANDKETEAALHCLAAEISCQEATAQFGKIAALQNRDALETYRRRMTGQGSTASSEAEIEELRVEAINSLASAKTTYEKATALIRQINVKTPYGPVSGAKLVWQVQIGQAAAHVLHATLLTDTDPAGALAEKEEANILLQEAVKDREQSPALAPAVDTLLFLRDSVK